MKVRAYAEYLERRNRARTVNNFVQDYQPHERQRVFHAAGKDAKERLFLAGNRTGKTYCGIIEGVMHLTGLYPKWWKGKRFTRGIKMWAASVTTSLTKEVLEGGYLDVVPPLSILGQDLQKSTFRIRHSSGGISFLAFKSYEQGRQKFQAAQLDFIHLDEEPSLGIYTEALMRTMSTDAQNQGALILTMTPLLGVTELVHRFTDGKDADTVDSESGKFYTMARWDDNPHLLEKEKQTMLESLPEHERDARERGIPSMGSGMVYPVSEQGIVVDPFQIPGHWAKVYAIDFGWTAPTAALFAAYDRDNNIVYLYGEYYVSQRTPQQHSVVLAEMGACEMPGVYDPAGDQKSQKDGNDIVSMYRQAGLKHLFKANNAKEEGVLRVLQRMQNGGLKIFSTLENTLTELRMYARDEQGNIKKGNDHLMDCMRYLVMSGLNIAGLSGHNYISQPVRNQNLSWMSF